MDSSLRSKYKRLGVFTIIVILVYVSPLWVEKYPFLESDKEWISPFSCNDTLFFHADTTNAIDTITYFNIRKDGPEDYFPFEMTRFVFITWLMGNVGPWNSNFNIPIFWTHKNIKSKYIGFFSLSRNKDTGRVGSPNLSILFDKYSYKDHREDEVESIAFNNKSLPAIIVNEKTSQVRPLMSGDTMKISEVIWSKPYGIIEYTLTSGEKYRLVEYRHADGRIEKFDHE